MHGESAALLLLWPDPRHGSEFQDAVAAAIVAAAIVAGLLFPLFSPSLAGCAMDLWVVDLVCWGLSMVVALQIQSTKSWKVK